MIIVRVFVDDILTAGKSRALINEVKRYIEEHFQIKDLSPVKTMLGINISCSITDGLLCMDQSKMIIMIFNLNSNPTTIYCCRVTVEKK